MLTFHVFYLRVTKLLSCLRVVLRNVLQECSGFQLFSICVFMLKTHFYTHSILQLHHLLKLLILFWLTNVYKLSQSSCYCSKQLLTRHTVCVCCSAAQEDAELLACCVIWGIDQCVVSVMTLACCGCKLCTMQEVCQLSGEADKLQSSSYSRKGRDRSTLVRLTTVN